MTIFCFFFFLLLVQVLHNAWENCIGILGDEFFLDYLKQLTS